MATNLSSVKDNNVDWMVQPYGVVVGSDYASYEAMLQKQLAIVANDTGGSAGSLISGVKSLDSQGFITDPTSYLYKSPSVSDASIGGNDAINPYAAFGLDDDIVHQIHSTNSGSFGMGRCYSEIYDSKQQIVYITAGIPKYRNLTTWLKNATKKELSELNDNGKLSNFSLLGTLLSGIKLAVALPWLPIIWSCKLVDSIKNDKVTEYFMFRDTMPLYYRYVNTIMSHIAVGMGIYGGGTANTAGTETGGNGANMTQEQSNQYQNNMPEILKEGPDIFKIMCKRSSRMGKAVTNDNDHYLKSMKDYKDNPEEKVSDVFTNFWSGLQTGALEGANFLGFRIERSDQAGETFSNSTQDSSLASKLNSEVQAARDRNLGENSGGGIAALARRWGAKVHAAKEALTKFQNGDLEGTITYLASGNGYFDLPKQWAGSSGMSRSLSFNMKLRAKTGGDNVSIFQSIMIPIACLLAAALPRAAGDTTYTAPFILRVFSRGMFSIPAGIISSLSITRGASEFGWSLNRLPTVVDVSFSIEDLSPMLFLSLAGNGVFQQAFSNNTKMHEYLSTLTGIGCKERYFKMGRIKRQIQAAMLASRNTTFSPLYWGYATGDSALIRSIMALTPWHRVKNN